MSQSLKLWRESKKKPFIFHSKKYGVVRLRKFLSINDFEVLVEHLKNDKIDLKEFTVRVLNDVVLVTPEENLQNWEDSILISIARKWAKKVMPEDISEKGIKNFEDFKATVSEHINRMFKATGEAIKMVGESLKNIRITLADQMAEMASQSFKEFARVFDSVKLIQVALSQAIPDFQRAIFSIQESVKNADDARSILALSEYELALLIINVRDLVSLKDKKFEPTITNKLFNLTKKDEFVAEVESIFASSQLKKRLPALKQALIAHQSHQFYLSTPVFISQTDGIFTDWLILLKLACREKGRIIACKEEGVGKTEQLNSLRARVKHAKENLNTEGLLKTAIDDVLTRSIGDRNFILHGENCNYGTAKNSTQALLMVLFFAGVLKSAIKNTKKHNS